MWQVPLIAMTLTGGLWYGVSASTLEVEARVGLLTVATLANAALGGLVLPRVRNVMAAHLAKMKEFYPNGFPVTKPSSIPVFGGDRGTMRVYAGLLLIAAFLSGAAAVQVFRGKMGMRDGSQQKTDMGLMPDADSHEDVSLDARPLGDPANASDAAPPMSEPAQSGATAP
ncbi:MAG: hypothetical protein DYH12_11450 [Sorangiineae bacterium PRO1]|nr:hypothetical protein [Sorangiineae bacterium PRO1]